MKLLTSIIGPAPSELDPEQLMTLIKRNRVRIRREIKEYRRLRNALREEAPKRGRGKPPKAVSTMTKQKQMEFAKLISESNVTMAEVLAELKAMKEKKNA
jgi:hypothetical protein